MFKKTVSSSAPVQSRGVKAQEELVLTALELFAAKGYEATSTRDISQKSGQNIAAINYYFGNKEGLYMAALEKGLQFSPQFDDTIRRVEASLAKQNACAEEYLGAIIIWIRGAALSLTDEDKNCCNFVRLMLREQFSPSTAFRNTFQKVMIPKHDLFVKLVSRYLGISPEAMETRVIAHALMGPFLAFRAMPELVSQKTGIKKIGKAEAEMIADVITRQAEAALRGMRAQGMEQSLDMLLGLRADKISRDDILGHTVKTQRILN